MMKDVGSKLIYQLLEPIILLFRNNTLQIQKEYIKRVLI